MNAVLEKLQNSPDSGPLAISGTWLRPATIRVVHADARVDVRVSVGDGTEALGARLLELAGYQPSVGDRVLVAGDPEGAFVIGVIHSAAKHGCVEQGSVVQDGVVAPRIDLADGSRAQLRDGKLELRDADDRLLMRYADGNAELCAPSGDLALSAPHGRVTLKAATDVSIEANRDVTSRAGRRLELGVEGNLSSIALQPNRTTVDTPKLEVRTKHADVASGKTTFVGRTIAVTANHVAQNVERYELYAQKLVERARTSVREVSGLAQSTVGRARSVVHGIYSLRTRRSIMISEQDTNIDGERILLG